MKKTHAHLRIGEHRQWVTEKSMRHTVDLLDIDAKGQIVIHPVSGLGLLP